MSAVTHKVAPPVFHLMRCLKILWELIRLLIVMILSSNVSSISKYNYVKLFPSITLAWYGRLLAPLRLLPLDCCLDWLLVWIFTNRNGGDGIVYHHIQPHLLRLCFDTSHSFLGPMIAEFNLITDSTAMTVFNMIKSILRWCSWWTWPNHIKNSHGSWVSY